MARRDQQARHIVASKSESQGYTFSNAGDVNTASVYDKHNVGVPSAQENTNAFNRSTQYTYPTDLNSENLNTSTGREREEQQYSQVPRHWASRNNAINQAVNDPALAYNNDHNYNLNHNYGYDANMAQTYHSYPEQSISNHGITRQLRASNLQSFNCQTTPSSSMTRWAQEGQRDGAWNVAGAVGKESDYTPYNPRL